jgi:hypothetical protein
MSTQVLTATDGRQALAEVGTIEHEGQSYSANGAFLSDDLLIGYVSADGTKLNTWSGDVLGPAWCVGTYRGFWRSTVRCYRVRFAGRTWHGRGSGPGMLIRLRPNKSHTTP